MRTHSRQRWPLPWKGRAQASWSCRSHQKCHHCSSQPGEPSSESARGEAGICVYTLRVAVRSVVVHSYNEAPAPFCVETVWLKTLYVLFFIELSTGIVLRGTFIPIHAADHDKCT